ncbi:MAG: hypothetical protein KGY81_01790, partial [Phycisphaerae bacterium]|nr:hypothetical protein [Phycisphaerae bacterium]
MQWLMVEWPASSASGNTQRHMSRHVTTPRHRRTSRTSGPPGSTDASSNRQRGLIGGGHVSQRLIDLFTATNHVDSPPASLWPLDQV